MAKRIIQMYDKYQSTTKVYPKIIKDCLQEDVTDYVEGQVKANPTLAGTEASLTGIQVGDTKYKVEQPINVVANPTLAGTEAGLESIEIGDTKYKISGGGKQLYTHNISFKTANDTSRATRATMQIINDSDTAFTADTLKAYLISKGFTTYEHLHELSGIDYVSQSSACYVYSGAYADSNGIYCVGIRTSTGAVANDFALYNIFNEDIVTTL